MSPKHGLERFTIKIKKTANIQSDKIKLVFRSRPEYDLRYILVGRKVSESQIQECIVDYLRKKDLYDKLVNFKII
jgi:hypothetical protein